MKRIIILLGIFALLLAGCSGQTEADTAQIAATTLPVYEFTSTLCEGTGLTVTRLVNESVSCLHDYSLNVEQVKAAEAAELIVVSGAGLEDFMEDILTDKQVIDASTGITLLQSCDHSEGVHNHTHENDPHIWLDPNNALVMVDNIYKGLVAQYPEHETTLLQNRSMLIEKIMSLKSYGEKQLSNLSSTQMITFHDGFAYFADAYGLEILASIEEESGAEASAAELQEIVTMVRRYHLKSIFVETNSSYSAAKTVATETKVSIYKLDMAMSGDSWFDAMYSNIDTIKEALG